MVEEPLLQVEDLKVRLYDFEKGIGWPVDGVSFKINKGETLGLTGESGSGKTTIAYSILRLIGNARTGTPDPMRECTRGLFGFHTKLQSEREIVNGKIVFKGKDLLSLSEDEMTNIRGKEISMIFQNPISAMNPMMIVGYQVGEPKEVHERLRWERIKQIVMDYLGRVGIPNKKKRYYFHPHLFSGGQGQRLMIAMALMCSPDLLIADEPTSSLDVMVQRQVLELIKRLRDEFKLSTLYITHDLSVIAEVSDKVAVMYAGQIIEYGDVITIFKKPKHPYTQKLLASYPFLYSKKKKLEGITGETPTPFDKFEGCKFYSRCEYAESKCKKEKPQPIEIEPGHTVSCLRAYEI